MLLEAEANEGLVGEEKEVKPLIIEREKHIYNPKRKLTRILLF